MKKNLLKMLLIGCMVVSSASTGVFASTANANKIKENEVVQVQEDYILDKEFKEYKINEDEAIKVYIGTLKEKFILDKSYDEAKWINKSRIDDCDIEELDKKILLDYFN